MHTDLYAIDTQRFARCIRAGERVRWDLERDVIRGRVFDPQHKFLPDGLSLIAALDFLAPDEARYLSRIQGRTYAGLFGLVERFITAKVLEVSRDHWFGDQTALDAMVRFSEEELKHQALFRRIDALAAAVMPAGYRFVADADAVARVVLGKRTWAVLALTLFIELFTQTHYRQSIADDEELSPLFRDVFLYHWLEESQHAVIDELEWRRIDAGLAEGERERAVDQLVELLAALRGIVDAQAAADAAYFTATCGRPLDDAQRAGVARGLQRAYRWQYLLSGARHTQFRAVLASLVDSAQARRVLRASAGGD